MVDFATSRRELHRVAAHVLARRRQAVAGRIGLRATPGGIGTPASGDGEVVRVAGTRLVHETADGTRVMPVAGASLRELAAFVGEDLDRPIDLGKDTPPVGAPDAPIAVDEGHLAELARWYHEGWRILDTVLGEVGPDAAPSVVQLWPEHFDAGADVAAGMTRVNVGVSPGDTFLDRPYLYVGPWASGRPGPTGYWNAPFGAVLAADDIGEDTAAVMFVLEGLSRLRT